MGGDDMDGIFDELEKEAARKGLPDIYPKVMRELSLGSVTKVSDANSKGRDDGFLGLLTSSVSHFGMFEPILVEDNGDGTYTLLDGKARMDSAKRTGMKTVPAIIVDGSRQNAGLAAVVSNFLRRKMNPIEEARAIKVLMEAHRLTQGQIGQALGLSHGRISQKLSLLKAPKPVRDKVASGEVKPTSVKVKTRDARPGGDFDESKKESLRSKGQRKRAAKAAADKGDEPAAEKSKIVLKVKVPATNLPDGVSLTVEGRRATVGLRFEIDEGNDVGEAVKRGAARLLKALDAGEVGKAYRAMRREMGGR